MGISVKQEVRLGVSSLIPKSERLYSVQKAHNFC